MLVRHDVLKDNRVQVYNASEVIEMDEKPIQAMKTKRDSSMMRAIDLVKIGTADAVLSCGNTGALMAGGTIRLRTMDGIERPALGTVIPGKFKNFIMIDVGAAPDPKPESLVDNAILGANYAHVALGIKNPRVGLLSNGTEDCKGNSLVQTAHQAFQGAGGRYKLRRAYRRLRAFRRRVRRCRMRRLYGKRRAEIARKLGQNVQGHSQRGNHALVGLQARHSDCPRGFQKPEKTPAHRQIFGRAPARSERACGQGARVEHRKQIAGAIEITLRCLRKQMQSRIKEDVSRLKEIVEKNKETARERERKSAEEHNTAG